MLKVNEEPKMNIEEEEELSAKLLEIKDVEKEEIENSHQLNDENSVNSDERSDDIDDNTESELFEMHAKIFREYENIGIFPPEPSILSFEEGKMSIIINHESSNCVIVYLNWTLSTF